MHPTVEEQLAAVRRLLEDVAKQMPSDDEVIRQLATTYNFAGELDRAIGRDSAARADYEAAKQLQVERHAFVSFTGGEPLLQPEPLAELARRLRGCGPKIHLETHGLHVDALERVLPVVDVVSMDWKLTSDVRRASDPKRGPVEAFHERQRGAIVTAS